MFPTLCFSVSPTCAVVGQLVVFQSHSLFDHTGLEHAHTFEKLTKFAIFLKIQIPVKLVQVVQILKTFTRK